MKNPVFGEMAFDIGWKALTNIILFGKSASITVKAKAYYEKDGITPEQEAAFSDFNDNKEQRLEKTEKLLSGYAGDNAAGRFVPRTLLFERDGAYAILLDDKEDEDDGIVVCLLPMEIILSQNEYL